MQADPAWAALDARHGRALVDLHATLEEDAAQPAGQQRRLDGRGARHEDALAEDGGGAAGLHAITVDVGELPWRAESFEVGDRAGPVVAFSRKRVDAEVPLRREVGVHAVTLAPLPDSGHDLVGGLPDAQRLGRPVPLRQVGEVLPPAVQEAAVAAAGSAAADVGLEQGDPRLRSDLAEEIGGPHPGVATADDRDVRCHISEERRRQQCRSFGGEGLPQPPRAALAGDRDLGRRLGGHVARS